MRRRTFTATGQLVLLNGISAKWDFGRISTLIPFDRPLNVSFGQGPTCFPQAPGYPHSTYIDLVIYSGDNLPMTTVQETSNNHRVSPPPSHDATGIVSSDLSAGVPANQVHRERGISREPLPDRCQFTFSDSRQCTMARSDIHPSLCPFHAEREEQLFGSPSPGGHVVGRALDLPELHSACRDLTTAAGVNRALAQVFRLLAQRRISRQEAATFGHLAQLLLRTITLARAESAAAPAAGDRANAAGPVILSSGESHQQDELSPVNKVERERRISPKPAPEPDTSPASSPACEPVPSRQHKNPAARENAAARADSVSNSSEINTYENVELKSLQNEHLQNNERVPHQIPSGTRELLSRSFPPEPVRPAPPEQTREHGRRGRAVRHRARCSETSLRTPPGYGTVSWRPGSKL